LGNFVKANNQSGKTFLAIVVLPSLTVAALWIPFGFSLGGLIEEWDALFLFAQHGVFYIADSASPLQAHKARPLTVLSQAIAYTLDPNSFFYWHIIQAASLVVKAACAGMIGIYLTGNRALAASLALLTLLYPADTMQLNFRSLHINCAVALALVASVAIIFAAKIAARGPRIIVGAVASATLVAALLMYEAVVGLAALPHLVIFAREGKGAIRVIRERLDVFIIWVCAIAGWLVFFIWSIRTGAQLQRALLSDADLNSLVERLGALVSSGLYRAFYECWIELLRVILDLNYFVYPTCFTIIVVIALVWLSTELPERATSIDKRLGTRIIVVGLVAFIFAYAPYVSDAAHLLITQRTFLAAAIGAALVLLGCVVLLSTVFDRRVVAAMSGVLIGGCFVVQLYQFDKYNRIYASITRPILSAVIPFISASIDGPYAVLFDDYGYLSGLWDLGTRLQVALGYVLPGIRASHVFICETRSGRLLPRGPGPTTQRGYCKRTEDGIVMAGSDGTPALLKDAAVATLGADGVVLVEKPKVNLSETVLPSRALQLFAPSKWRPADSMFGRARADRYECRFESMWGYALPCRTFGFYDALPYRTALGSSYAWIGETNAGLIFDIEPSQGSYQLVVKLLDIASPPRVMEVNLNGTKLATKWQDPLRIEAVLSGDLLRRANNVLELSTQLDDKLGLSFAIKSISIMPTNQ
jgi:hypothetical protein